MERSDYVDVVQALVSVIWQYSRGVEMQTNNLVALLKAVYLGSFSKAADEMGYSKPALTYMIDTLEAEIGVTLLVRSHSGVTFTKKGIELEPFIRSLLDAEAALRAKATEKVENHAERIIIGVCASVSGTWLPDVIEGILNENPGVDIHIRVGGIELLEWLEKDDIDFAIVGEELSENYEWLPIQDDQLFIAVPACWPFPLNGCVQLETLIDTPILVLAANEKNAGISALEKLGIKKKILISSQSTTTLWPMIGAGLGVAMISKYYMLDCPSTVRMFPTEPPLIRKLGIILKSYESASPLTKKFIACLRLYVHEQA